MDLYDDNLVKNPIFRKSSGAVRKVLLINRQSKREEINAAHAPPGGGRERLLMVMHAGLNLLF